MDLHCLHVTRVSVNSPFEPAQAAALAAPGHVSSDSASGHGQASVSDGQLPEPKRRRTSKSSEQL